ncbi:hypothetical protein BC829DRAFT_422151 [Chytridium lagenaria]|nr:hypothetical protein BC829DRAFT_422151 [Chytridium lagenaria]
MSKKRKGKENRKSETSVKFGDRGIKDGGDTEGCGELRGFSDDIGGERTSNGVSFDAAGSGEKDSKATNTVGASQGDLRGGWTSAAIAVVPMSRTARGSKFSRRRPWRRRVAVMVGSSAGSTRM